MTCPLQQKDIILEMFNDSLYFGEQDKVYYVGVKN